MHTFKWKNTMNRLLLIFALVGLSNTSVANEIYRTPSQGDVGTYFILSKNKQSDGLITVLESRIGKNNAYTDFTKLNIDCNSKKYFELAGNTEDGKQDKPSKPLNDWSGNSKWTFLVPGSSKSDLVTYVCRSYQK